MTAICGHLLCDIIGGSCSLTAGRSRGCTPGLTSKAIAPDVLDEVRVLVAAIDPEQRGERVHAAAVRLAQIIRREARDDRNMLALVGDDEPELAPALARLCRRNH